MLSVAIGFGGRVLVESLTTGRGWDVPPGTFNIGTVPGRSYQITANPDVDATFDHFVGGGCNTANPCTVTLTTSEEVDVYFSQ